MSAFMRHEIRRGAYYDSIVLMELRAVLLEQPGVVDCAAQMATEANLEILTDSGLLPEGLALRAEDLLVVVRAATDEVAEAALEKIDSVLKRRRSGSSEYRPRSLAAALRAQPEANWVVVSVPGRWAARVAREALSAERHVFLYSDNVPVEEEVELKALARQEGRLLLGPDCGTAMVAGTGLGFWNRVRRGALAVVAASGTGAQSLAVEIDALGAGVSAVLGTGGRDLSADVAGRSFSAALDLLERDAATRGVVLVSKTPDARVAAAVLSKASRLSKPVVVHFQGSMPPLPRVANLHFARSLDAAAKKAVDLLGAPALDGLGQGPANGKSGLRGLFSGGTLAREALEAARFFLQPIASNLEAEGVVPLSGKEEGGGEHSIVDLGDDRFTVGALHPMMDPTSRLRAIEREADDPTAGVLLLDVILGYAAHPDPAAALAPAIRGASERGLVVVVLLVGSSEDPQMVNEQQLRLEDAGARVVRRPSEAWLGAIEVSLAASTADVAEKAKNPVPLEVLSSFGGAIQVGIETLHQALVDQEVPSLWVDWRPPAGGNERLVALLDRLGSPGRPRERVRSA